MKCEYCHTDKDGYIKPLDKNGHVFLDVRDCCEAVCINWYGHKMRVDIDFCPKCGRSFWMEDRE